MAASVSAAPRQYLARDERFCDTERVACVDGSIRYDANPRLFRVQGRLTSSPGPGLLRIRIAGQNRQGDRKYSVLEIYLRGSYSEIIDFKMIPDHPDVSAWHITTIKFEPGADRREAR